MQDAVAKAQTTGKHPKHFLFFAQNPLGQRAANEFLTRLNERTQDRDKPASNETVVAQITAIHAWGNGPATALEKVEHPVLVANGDHDVMVPTVNSVELARRLPNAQLSIFPNAGHGGIFEYHVEFVPQALAFLAA